MAISTDYYHDCMHRFPANLANTRTLLTILTAHVFCCILHEIVSDNSTPCTNCILCDMSQGVCASVASGRASVVAVHDHDAGAVNYLLKL
jgi:hypothetical protein